MRSPSPLVLGIAATGLVFLWSAVHGANIGATLRDLLAGRAALAPDDPALTKVARALPGGTTTPSGTPSGGAEIAVFGSHSAAGNRANAQLQAAGRGWTGSEWTALDKLWTRESDFNNLAQNPHSTAYGIAQFLDATWAGVGGTKTSDPTLQIRYGLDYIAARYGRPSAAWAHEQANSWY